MSIPRRIRRRVPNLVPISPVVWQLPQTFEYVTPPKTPWGIEGRIVFSIRPFPDESADLYHIWCQSVQPFDSFPKHLNLWPPKKNRNAPGVLWDELYLAYVHSQRNPPTCTTFGANQCSRLTASADFLICDPITPPPPPPKCPQGYWGQLWFSLCPFPDESADVNQSGCQSVQPFDSFPILLNVWPLNNPRAPLRVSRGNLFGVYPFSDGYADVCQIWCQYVQPFDSFLRLLKLWHPNPPPPNAPWGIEGQLVFSLCPFPDESADVNQSWCQSDSFTICLRVCPYRFCGMTDAD